MSAVAFPSATEWLSAFDRLISRPDVAPIVASRPHVLVADWRRVAEAEAAAADRDGIVSLTIDEIVAATGISARMVGIYRVGLVVMGMEHVLPDTSSGGERHQLRIPSDEAVADIARMYNTATSG